MDKIVEWFFAPNPGLWALNFLWTFILIIIAWRLKKWERRLQEENKKTAERQLEAFRELTVQVRALVSGKEALPSPSVSPAGAEPKDSPWGELPGQFDSGAPEPDILDEEGEDDPSTADTWDDGEAADQDDPPQVISAADEDDEPEKTDPADQDELRRLAENDAREASMQD